MTGCPHRQPTATGTKVSVEVVQIYLSKEQNITSFELSQHYLKVFGVFY